MAGCTDYPKVKKNDPAPFFCEWQNGINESHVWPCLIYMCDLHAANQVSVSVLLKKRELVGLPPNFSCNNPPSAPGTNFHWTLNIWKSSWSSRLHEKKTLNHTLSQDGRVHRRSQSETKSDPAPSLCERQNGNKRSVWIRTFRVCRSIIVAWTEIVAYDNI